MSTGTSAKRTSTKSTRTHSVPDRPRPWREAWRDRIGGAKAVFTVALRSDPYGVVMSSVLGVVRAGLAPLTALALKRVTDGVTSGHEPEVVSGLLLFAVPILIGQI